MAPKLTGIDHVHVYVGDRGEAEAWYGEVMGFKRVEELMAWAVPKGPLTIESPQGKIHLALFERAGEAPLKAIAFGTTADAFMSWKARLEERGLPLRLADHELSYSLYFSDPWENQFEITTYERDEIAALLAQDQ